MNTSGDGISECASTTTTLPTSSSEHLHNHLHEHHNGHHHHVNMQQLAQETKLFNNLFHATYDASKKNSGSSLFVEFLKQIKWGVNIMNVSVPSVLMSGLSLLETTARTNAPTTSLLMYVFFST